MGSSAIACLQHAKTATIYSTASINKIGESRVTDFTDVLLQMPIIMPVLLAAAFLTGFYLWLSSLEREISKLQIQ